MNFFKKTDWKWLNDTVIVLGGRGVFGLFSFLASLAWSKLLSKPEFGALGALNTTGFAIATVVDLGSSLALSSILSKYALAGAQRQQFLSWVFRIRRSRLKWLGVIPFVSPVLSYFLLSDTGYWTILSAQILISVPCIYLAGGYRSIALADRQFNIMALAKGLSGLWLAVGTAIGWYLPSWRFEFGVLVFAFSSAVEFLILKRVPNSAGVYSTFSTQIDPVLIKDYKRVSTAQTLNELVFSFDQPISFSIISALSQRQEAGDYYFATNLLRPITLVTESLTQVFFSRVMAIKSLARTKKLLRYAALFSLPLMIVVAVAVSLLFKPLMFFFPQFETARMTVVVLAVAVTPGLLFNPLVSSIYHLRLEYAQVVVNLITFIIVSSLKLILVSRMGAVGVVLALLIGKVFAWASFLFLTLTTIEKRTNENLRNGNHG